MEKMIEVSAIEEAAATVEMASALVELIQHVDPDDPALKMGLLEVNLNTLKIMLDDLQDSLEAII